MNHEEMNHEIRETCKNLMIDGYKKAKICGLLLGMNSQPMFENFISKDKNFGVAVLARMLKMLDYEILLVPVKKEDKEKMLPTVTKLDEAFQKEFSEALRTGLDQKLVQARPSVAISNIVNDTISKLIPNLEENQNNAE